MTRRQPVRKTAPSTASLVDITRQYARGTLFADDLFPRWAHVPGQTTSADRERLDRALVVVAGDDDAKLAYGLHLLHRCFAWEAHEILEDLWRRARPNSRRRDGLRILIQIANAGLKETMNRPAAAARLWGEAAAALRTLIATGQPEGGLPRRQSHFGTDRSAS